MEITLPKTQQKVTIKDEMTWGDSKAIEKAFMSGTNMQSTTKKAQEGDVDLSFDPEAQMEAIYVMIQQFVTNIEEDGQEKQFSRNWLDNLPMEDGDALYEKVNEVYNQKKES